MPTKRVLRDMLHVAERNAAYFRDGRTRARTDREQAIKELAEVRATYLAPWECELLHAGEVDTLAKERDSARTVAVRLEQENALLTAALKAYADAFGAIGTEFRAAAIATHRVLAGGQA